MLCYPCFRERSIRLCFVTTHVEYALGVGQHSTLFLLSSLGIDHTHLDGILCKLLFEVDQAMRVKRGLGDEQHRLKHRVVIVDRRHLNLLHLGLLNPRKGCVSSGNSRFQGLEGYT